MDICELVIITFDTMTVNGKLRRIMHSKKVYESLKLVNFQLMDMEFSPCLSHLCW